MGTRLMEDMDILLKGTRHRGYPTLLPGRILLHLVHTLRSMVATRLTVAIPPSATLATVVAMVATVDTLAMEVVTVVSAMVSDTTTEAMATATTVTEAMATDTTVTGTTMAGTAGGTMAMDITTTTASMGTASSRGASDVHPERLRFNYLKCKPGSRNTRAAGKSTSVSPVRL